MEEKFSPKIDSGWFSANVVEAPNIEYDIQEIKPTVIAQEKWDVIFKLLVFLALLFIIWINFIVSQVYDISAKIALKEVSIEDLTPIVKKIETTTRWLNYEQMSINWFVLENLFFVWDKNYEIIQKYRRFFEDPRVASQLWDFNLTNISIDWNASNEWNVTKIPIKIDWNFSSFNRDVLWMISFLNRMSPVIIMQELSFWRGNSVSFVWEIVSVNKELLSYNYWEQYEEINKILRLKEEYDANNLILERLLDDEDINFERVWISRIYNCNQYEELLEKQNLIKDAQLSQCKDIEKLLDNLKMNIDNSFNNLTQE